MFRLPGRRRWPGFALLLLSIVWGGSARADSGPAGPQPGHTRTLAANRATAAPVIDGVLDDAVWQRGVVADAFWVSDWQQSPTEQTRVVVLYDDHALYFAFTCLDGEPGRIRATQLTRDAAPGLDDRVTVELDPYHNHRSVSHFTVTARGTQSDATAGGRARNREWKGVWSAAVARTPSGWTAEIAIPFDILEFDVQADTFGINFSRYQNRTREWSHWADLTPQRLPEEAGHLTGLRLPSAAVPGRLSVMQYLSGGTGGMNTAASGRALATGADVRYQWRSAMTSVVSARPDFSDTDADAPGIGFSYNEKFAKDRRPFFQEGAAFFGSREIFHSGRIEQFDVGVKTFGRVTNHQLGILATTDASTGRTDYAGRIVREVGPAFNLGATLAGRDTATTASNTLQVQAAGRLGRNLRVTADAARSTSDLGNGTRRRGEIAYHQTHWYSGGWVDHTDPEYFPSEGFIAADLIGTDGRGAYGGYNRASGDGWMRRADASVSYERRDTATGLRQRETASIYAGAETSADIQLNAGMTIGTYRPRGSLPGRWTDVVNDDQFYLTSAYYQSPTGQFGYGAQYSWGVAGPQDYDSLTPSFWLAPSSHLSLAYSFERADQDHVQHQHVLSGTWEITDAQSFAARWTEYDGGYYRVSYRRALRHGVDAFGVYTSDPYVPRRLNVKVVWTLLPNQRQ
jgi:hypothetical protein